MNSPLKKRIDKLQEHADAISPEESKFDPKRLSTEELETVVGIFRRLKAEGLLQNGQITAESNLPDDELQTLLRILEKAKGEAGTPA